jgi:hypothetical protein
LEEASITGNKKSILVLITSSSNSTKSAYRREAIRTTWIKYLQLPLSSIPSYVFVVGLPEVESDRLALEAEQNRYNDLVILPVKDSYFTLTDKTLESMKYVVTNHPQLDYLVKVDDDVFLRVDRLTRLISTLPSHRLYLGHFHKKVKRYYGKGYPNNELLYPEEMEELVPFAAGSGYILSMDLVQYIVSQVRTWINAF